MVTILGLVSLVQTPALSLERKRENQRPVEKRSLSIATTRAPTRRRAAFEGLSNKECRRSSMKIITTILQMSSPILGSDSWVTSVLPNHKSTPSGDAAVWIAFRDTRNAHARKKINRLFLDLSRWILRDIDLCTRGNRVGRRRAWLSGTVQH